MESTASAIGFSCVGPSSLVGGFEERPNSVTCTPSRASCSRRLYTGHFPLMLGHEACWNLACRGIEQYSPKGRLHTQTRERPDERLSASVHAGQFCTIVIPPKLLLSARMPLSWWPKWWSASRADRTIKPSSVSADNLVVAPMLKVRRSDARNDLLPEEPDLLLVHSEERAEDKLRDTPALDAPPKLRRALLWRAYHRDR